MCRPANVLSWASLKASILTISKKIAAALWPSSSVVAGMVAMGPAPPVEPTPEG